MSGDQPTPTTRVVGFVAEGVEVCNRPMAWLDESVVSADQPLTADELATIRARAEDLDEWHATVAWQRRTLGFIKADTLRLVAEIERLQAKIGRVMYLAGHETTLAHDGTRWIEAKRIWRAAQGKADAGVSR